MNRRCEPVVNPLTHSAVRESLYLLTTAQIGNDRNHPLLTFLSANHGPSDPPMCGVGMTATNRVARSAFVHHKLFFVFRFLKSLSFVLPISLQCFLHSQNTALIAKQGSFQIKLSSSSMCVFGIFNSLSVFHAVRE